MAVHIVPDEAGLAIDSLRLYASKSGDGTVQQQRSLGGELLVDTDDIILIKGQNKTLYKCVVTNVGSTLGNESDKPQCIGIADLINSAPWEAVNAHYNATDLPCIDIRRTDWTIQEFIEAEFTGDVTTWFTSIEAEGDTGSIVLPETETTGRGFLDVINDILSPYPHLRWMIEYDPAEAVYPLGKLVIYDAMVGREEHSLTVGEDCTDVNITKDVNECAEHVHLYGFGDFTEKLEVPVPAWQNECVITRNNIGVEGPKTPQDNIQIAYEDDQFFMDLHLYANDAPWYDAANDGSPFAAGPAGGRQQMRLWPGGDIAYNIRTGEVRFLFAEEEEGNEDAKWWWVNNEDGTVYPPDHFDAQPGKTYQPQFIPGIIRRPITYRNSHLDERIRWWAQYDTFIPEAFRTYQVSESIADFRIRETQFEDPDSGNIVDSFRQEPDSIDAYRPRTALTRYTDFEEEYEPANYEEWNGILFPGGKSATQQPWWITSGERAGSFEGLSTENSEGIFLVGSYTPVGGGFNLPTRQIPQLQPKYNISDTSIAFSMLLGFWEELESDVTFEEGTACVRTSNAQLAAYPEWNDIPVKVYEEIPIGVFGGGVIASSLRIDSRIVIYTWPLLIRYTAWENIEEYRTTPHGIERHAKNHMRSAFRYRDGINLDRSVAEPEPVTVFDNISQQDGPFLTAADMLEEYYGQINWKGSMTVLLTKGEDGWIVPFSVGDTVVLGGAVSPEVSGFRGLVNSIDLSRMDDGVATLNFGKHIPQRSPFMPAKYLDMAVDAENFEHGNPAQPAVTRT